MKLCAFFTSIFVVNVSPSFQNPPKFTIISSVQAKENYLMSAVVEAIDRMSSDERVKTMEYLWAAMTAAAEPESPAWHGDILDERRRRVAAGEEKFIPLEEAMRQLREEVAYR